MTKAELFKLLENVPDDKKLLLDSDNYGEFKLLNEKVSWHGSHAFISIKEVK